MCGKICSCSEAFTTAVALIVSSRAPSTGTRQVFAQLVGGVGLKLALSAETTATVRAGELLHGEVHAQVILHGQAVGVSGVAHVAVVLASLVQVLVIGQASSMTVAATTFFTGEGPTTLRVIRVVWTRRPSPLILLLEALVTVVLVHMTLVVTMVLLVLARGLLVLALVHGLHLGRTPFIAASVWIHASILLAVLLVQSQVIH